MFFRNFLNLNQNFGAQCPSRRIQNPITKNHYSNAIFSFQYSLKPRLPIFAIYTKYYTILYYTFAKVGYHVCITRNSRLEK